jgi:hypothetical protein
MFHVNYLWPISWSSRGLVQTRVTLAPARFVAGSHWGHRRSARIGPPGKGPKCYPKPASGEPGRRGFAPPAAPGIFGPALAGANASRKLAGSAGMACANGYSRARPREKAVADTAPSGYLNNTRSCEPTRHLLRPFRTVRRGPGYPAVDPPQVPEGLR